MRSAITVLFLVAASLWGAGVARAGEATSADVQAAVEAYAASIERDATLVGGPGSAGYDAGFWIRGGDFSLRINLTLQARWEAWDWDDDEFDPPSPGGDLSGFSLPRATVKLSGTAPCDTRYYMELEFGHPGQFLFNQTFLQLLPLGPQAQSDNFSNTREAWIEWGPSPAFNVRMGQIKLASTRQLMTPPELQQFVDVSYLSAFTGSILPGYTDRNRDHGIMFHGGFGCENEFTWMFQVTNGDSGDSIRNIHDGRTDDNLAYGGRVNWAFLSPIGYEEGALRQSTCEWYGEVGAWAYYHADRVDNPHVEVDDFLRVGADVALGTGGFSFTGAFLWFDNDVSDTDGWGWLVQAGYLFPDTAWEVAARFDTLNRSFNGGDDVSAWEAAAAVSYYLNGHGNKLTVDVTWVEGDDLGIQPDPYAGYNFVSRENSALMIRFQWQLAL